MVITLSVWYMALRATTCLKITIFIVISPKSGKKSASRPKKKHKKAHKKAAGQNKSTKKHMCFLKALHVSTAISLNFAGFSLHPSPKQGGHMTGNSLSLFSENGGLGRT